MSPARLFAAGLLLLAPWLAAAQSSPGTTVTTPQVRAELLAQAPDGVQPGKPVWVGLQITKQGIELNVRCSHEHTQRACAQ